MLLERLIAKVMQKVMDVMKKVIGNVVSGVKELEKSIHAENTPAVQSERKKIPFPVYEVVRLGEQYHLELPVYEKIAKKFKGC